MSLNASTNNQKPGNCVKCGKYTEIRTIAGLCYDCAPFGGNGFNREKFYSKTLDVISFNSVGELVSNFDSLKGIPGVWAINDSNGVVYDVTQTKDIGSEMYKYLRRLNFNKNLTDEEINIENRRYLYNRKKYRDIMNDIDKINFILISRNIDSKEERELIEMQYAHDTKAKYWSPALGQNSIL